MIKLIGKSSGNDAHTARVHTHGQAIETIYYDINKENKDFFYRWEIESMERALNEDATGGLPELINEITELLLYAIQRGEIDTVGALSKLILKYKSK